MNESQTRHGRSGWLGGLILVAIGAALLAYNLTGFGGEALLLALGIVFLIGYAGRRTYGLLVAGSILTGLGSGVLAQTSGWAEGGIVVLGLGIGFLAIYPVDYLVSQVRLRWWPLIPGGILAFVGLADLTRNQPVIEQAGRFWPVLLIGLGIWVLVARYRGRQV